MVEFDFAKIEKKWQKKWADGEVFEVDDKGKNPYYVLEMFAYPSGTGLHMGHAFNFVIGDILTRFKMMEGFNVLHPVGYDSLGLPAENAAIKDGTHPTDYTKKSIPNFMKQQKGLGLSYDWSRLVNTADSSYYKWDQWIFLKMFEKGLAYQKTSAVNWCPSCKTVLANEQAQTGMCDRCDSPVEIKHLKQWFLKITDYADELYEGIEKLDWPDKTKAMQRNWIGKSHGTEIDFLVGDAVSNVVIVHGCPDSNEPRDPKKRTYEKHWRLWLNDELVKRNIETSIPMMPEPWNADYSKWKDEFDKIGVNENSVLIGHSCGSAFLVRWLGDTKRKIKKLILVAPWKIAHKEDGSDKDFYGFEIDDDIKERVEEIVIFTSNNEEPDGKKSVKIFTKGLGARVVELKDKGHFTFNGMGTHEFPELLDEAVNVWPIFTTRPDTIFGVTFMVVAAQHPKLDSLVTDKQRKEVDKFLKKVKSVSEKDVGDLEKEGVFTGSYAVNPTTNEKIPIWAANFVIADYGGGMVMADAHDQRDLEFAHKYKINLVETILPEGGKSSNPNKAQRAFTGYGVLTKSGKFDGLKSKEAIEKITDWLIKNKNGRRVVNFKLRDWGISRQRYWGTPIPIIHCEKCGAVPVPEKDLPVELPKDIKFGKGNPLETNEKWLNVRCPKCGGEGRRESDTMDTFVNSSWYFMRFCDSKNNNKIFDMKKVNYWCPIDSYIGGAEHACMHLIYSRFYVKFLRDLGLVNFDEPAVRLFHQGMINNEKGEKMSKSKGNFVEPLETMAKYGVDTTRLFLVSVAAPDKGFDWSEKGIQGSSRFIKRIVAYFRDFKSSKDSKEVLSKLNKTIKNVSNYYENFIYRKATIEIRELFDLIEKEKVSKDTLEKFLKLISPICPHITEELWAKLGNKDFISTSKWPKTDKKKIKEKEQISDLNEKIIDRIKTILKPETKKIFIYVMPFELNKIDVEKISKKIEKVVAVFAVNDSGKYDPEGRAKKAKPGMAAIYLE